MDPSGIKIHGHVSVLPPLSGMEIIVWKIPVLVEESGIIS